MAYAHYGILKIASRRPNNTYLCQLHMSKKGKVLMAMSGGIDSTVAALMLHKEGYEVVGITMKTWDYAASGGGTTVKKKPAAAILIVLTMPGRQPFNMDFRILSSISGKNLVIL